MKNIYTAPKLGLNIFSADDIITASAGAFANEVMEDIKSGRLSLNGKTLNDDTSIIYVDMSK